EPVAVALGRCIVVIAVVVVIIKEGSLAAGVLLEVFFGSTGFHRRTGMGS
ncbi:hypothetical protein BD310DRAFT_633937, partial [Dichomitus squalens]